MRFLYSCHMLILSYHLTIFISIPVGDNVNILQPNDVGTFHTEVFEQFATIYSQRKQTYTTSTKKENYFIQILKSYCDHDDIECINRIDKLLAVAQDFISTQDPQSGRIVDFNYPKHMNKSLQMKLDEIFAVLPILNENNLNEVLQIMKDTKTDIERISNVNVVYKKLALSAVSVAIESTKLWHGVFFDERNLLNSLCRAPVWSMPLVLPFVISADIVGLFLMGPMFPIIFIPFGILIWFILSPLLSGLACDRIACIFGQPSPANMICPSAPTSTGSPTKTPSPSFTF